MVSDDALRALTQWILEFLGVAGFFGEKDAYPFRFRSQPVKPNKPESEDDPLNNFFLDELALVAESIREGVKSQPLDQYLRRHNPQSRLQVDDDRASQALIERLAPAAYANSCWPTERHLGLVHSQQLAVNTILSTLGNGRGVLGVNGPPGTGKTTLLRDLIAAVITGRADELAKLRRASDAFARSAPEIANHGGREQSCFKLNPALYGFEIVVASSNNGAVENVTLELPQRDKIDESWLPEAEYFADLGKLITDKAAWGMISGALGSKSRRTEFVNSYFLASLRLTVRARKNLRSRKVPTPSPTENRMTLQPIRRRRKKKSLRALWVGSACTSKPIGSVTLMSARPFGNTQSRPTKRPRHKRAKPAPTQAVSAS